MKYYVIERFPDPIVVTDEEGYVKYFETAIEAQIEADDCQDGIVLEL
jgi:hypothetical protein